jgi:hypothetical protein
MKLEIMFTTSDLILFSGAALVTILGLIFILRRYMNHQAEVDLTEKYKDKEWKSPLEARTKYPDVDAFRLRGYILRFSFVMTLAVALFAFNWTSYEQEVFIPDDALALEEEIEIEPPRTQEAQPPPPPPPPPQIQEVPETEIIEEDESIFQDMSVDAETQIFDAPVADTDAEKRMYLRLLHLLRLPARRLKRSSKWSSRCLASLDVKIWGQKMNAKHVLVKRCWNSSTRISSIR